jgi:hypothetical protein
MVKMGIPRGANHYYVLDFSLNQGFSIPLSQLYGVYNQTLLMYFSLYKTYTIYFLSYFACLPEEENPKCKKYIFERVNEMAARMGCTPSHLALAWVVK